MTCPRSGRRSRPARATTRTTRTSTWSCLERGRRGRGHGHRPHRPGLRRRGLPARQGARPAGRRPDRRGGRLPRRLREPDRDATSATSTDPIVEHLKREGRFYRLETITHRYPHCWRCGTPLVFRLVDEWFISMGPLYDQPRETLTPEQVDASLRYQIMEVVDQIRWIPDFGYERELDWLRNMHDWMISKKRYWGLALPIYDCSACGRGRGHRRPRRAQGARGRGLGRRSRATPRTGRTWTRSRSPARLRSAGRAHQGRRQPVARRRDRAVLDAPLPRGPGVLAAVVPGRLHHRELPRPVPQLVLLDARDVDGPAPRAAVQDDLRLRARCSPRTAARCTRARAT